jgi:plastocyanin
MRQRTGDSATSRRRVRWLAVGIVCAAALACAGTDGATEQAAGPSGIAVGTTGDDIYFSSHPDPGDLDVVGLPDQPGVEILRYEYGPIEIEPGQNNIETDGGVPQPDVDGYIVGITPDLVRTADGTVPPVDVIHLHHGVWINLSATEEEERAGGIAGELFFAAGEEKTRMYAPPGYGYDYEADDEWLINYMIHNLLTEPDQVYITYEIAFIPESSPAAADITPIRPVWMDVEKGELYPVFDVLRGTGEDGTYTYPDDADDPYGDDPPQNEWVADRDSVIIGAGGHLHPGGHHVDLFVRRDGAGATAGDAARPRVDGDSAHVLRSDAVYYEPAGAVSWDVSMTVTPFDYRVAMKAGDTLTISTTYDSETASWYESMGIAVVWLADGTDGLDPFEDEIDVQDTVLTHGHLPENDDHGGEETDAFVDATALPDGAPADEVTVADFTYAPGDIGGIYDDVPTVESGQPLRFTNLDAPVEPNGIWHTVTSCAPPCDRRTGVAYPLADAEVSFDSGEPGDAGPPTAGRLEWTIPENLDPGTYTYFCRIHPDMRGAFRVVE